MGFLDTATQKIVDWIKSTNGAAHVAGVGINGTPQTQTEIALITIKQLTFDPPIKACSIQAVAGSVTSVDADEAALVCFDPPNAAVAADWLNEANIAPRNVIKPADGIRNFFFDGATVSNIWLIAKGTTPDLDVTVEGIV